MSKTMNEMSNRELIEFIRSKTKTLDDIATVLVTNFMAARLANTTDLLEAALDFIDKHPGDPDLSKEQWDAHQKLEELRKKCQTILLPNLTS